MNKYELQDGTFRSVAPEHVTAFMQQFPQAIEVGKTNSSAGAIPTGGPSNMGFNSEDGSSVFTIEEETGRWAKDGQLIDDAFVPYHHKQAHINNLKSQEPGVKINANDAWYIKTLKVTDDWSAKTFRGIFSAVDGLGEYAQALELTTSDWYGDYKGESEQEKKTRREDIQLKQDANVVPQLMDQAIDWFGEQTIQSDINISKNLQDGNYLEAGRQTVGAALESIPSFVAAAYGWGGLTLLAASTAGNKFEEEYEKNPEVNTGRLLLNATGSGVIESGFELVTRGLMKRAGILKDAGNIAAAREVIEGGVAKVIANIGIGVVGEGSSEAATELTSLYWDKLTLDRDIDWDKAKYQIADAGIVGSFVGANITTFGEYTKSTPQAKERAITILTHPTINKELEKRAENLNVLVGDLATSSEGGKALIRKKIKQEILEIQGLRSRSEQGLLNLDGTEMQQYAKNVEESNKLNSILKSEKESDSAKQEARAGKEALDKANRHMLEVSSDRTLEANLAIAKDADAKIGLEQIVIPTDAEFAALPQGESGADGFISGNKVYINREMASKLASVSVGSHELLHGVVAGHLLGSDGLVSKNGIDFIDNMRSRMSSKERAIVEKRIEDNYKYERDSEGEKTRTKDKNEYYDEYLNVFHDAIVKKQITYNPAIEKIGQVFSRVFRAKGFDNIKFDNGRDVYDFVKTYSKDILKGKVSKETIAFAKPIAGKVDKKSVSTDNSSTVNELAEMGWTNESWKEQGADFAIKSMKDEKLLDGLIRSKYKAEIVPKNFVDLVYSELVSHVKNFKPEDNNSLFGWVNSQISNKAGNVYNREFKVEDEMKGAKDVDSKGKEGEVKLQVAAEKSSDVEAMENKDMSVGAQIAEKKAETKGEKEIKVESKFRKQLGIETGGILYNKVLDAARKSLLRAYEAGTSVRNIQRKLRDEANVYLFKDIKNFLGTTKYIKNLKEYRVPIMKSVFTADLVQMERNTPENERVFTRFVKKLTSKADVQAAVDQNQLPASALNIIDKGTAVSLYEKANPTEAQFMSYFDIPTINPKTGARSGTRGTRKDQLAKNMAGALSYDATMEVAQEPSTVQKRKDIAEIKGETLPQDGLERLAEAINRDINVKFSKTITPSKLKNTTLYLQSIENKLSDGNNTKPFFELTRILVEEGLIIEDAIAIAKQSLPAESNVLDLILNNGNFNNLHIDNIIWGINNFVLPKVRKLGHDTSIKYLTQQMDGKSTGVKVKLMNEYLTNVGRPTRSAGVDGITTNEQLYNEVIVPLGLSGHYQLADASIRGKKLQYKKGDNFLDVDLYENIENIKNNAHKNSGLVQKVNNQAKLAQEYVFKILDSNLTNAEKKAVVQLMAYDQRGALRKASKLGMVTKGLDASKTVLEHEFTIKDLQDKVNDYIDSKVNKKELQLQFDEGKVHVLPSSLDKVLGEQGIGQRGGKDRYKNGEFQKALNKLIDKGVVINTKPSKSREFQTIDSAAKLSLLANSPTKGITVLDFDDTLATSKSLIRFTRPDGTKGTLNAEQYASTYQELTELGYKWDFSEFTKVVDGKIAPLFQKALKLQEKFGNGNMFILTARPAESANAIHAFLKANGLNIPLKNITGLANSTAEAKALWVAEKVGEGYNDFYFADDALQNVKAVKNMLDQFDVKSKVQQARVKFSKSMDPAFNMMLERTTGVPAKELVSEARAIKRGNKKGRYAMFVPPSAEDFLGLLYYFAGRGKQGDADLAFLKKSLIDPLNRAYTELDETKQAIASDYRSLKKEYPDSAKKLREESPDEDFTYGDAVRVYLWNKSGIEIPGLNEKDQANLIELVTSDPELQQFADYLGLISRQEEGYTKPGDYWQVGDIRNDLDDATSKIGRKQFFTEFIENSDIIFSEENLNKIQSIYGSNFREALEDILYRTKTGSSRNKGSGRIEGNFNNWINGSVAATMFINTRSAMLQTLSSVNFINWGDNNPAKAAKAFANQKQYWSDFSMIFNSAKLKQRRSGLGMDINANELVTYMSKSKSSPKALLNWLLQKGFLPTQMADSFAIANGGAAFYRNRVNTYIKQGLEVKKAEDKAWNDFSEIAEATQQSARPDMVSQQQASQLGKYLLNFQNTPMQYTRLIKKAAIDLMKGRGDVKTNVSRIIYYGAVQNMIFYGLQTALFAMLFGDDEEEELTVDKNGIKPGKDGYIKTTKRDVFMDGKKARMANGMVDSLLRGTGIGGAFVSTVKNVIIEIVKQRKKKSILRDNAEVLIQALNLSPVVGIKARKINNYSKNYNYNEKVIDHMTTFDLDNPVWGGVTSIIEGTTNIPLNRAYKKVTNVRAALNEDNEAWQRLSTLLGFSTWDVGIENTEIDAIKAELKELNKKKKKGKKSSGPKKIYKNVYF